MTSGTGMEVAAAVVKLLRIRYFWGEKYESSVTELPGTCIYSCCHWWHFVLSPPLRRVQHFSIEKVMPCKIDTKNHIQILLTIACSFLHWFPIVILPRAHSLGKKVKIISVGFGVQKQGFSLWVFLLLKNNIKTFFIGSFWKKFLHFFLDLKINTNKYS